MTEQISNLRLLPHGAEIIWPARWPGKVGLVHDEFSGKMSVFHADEDESHLTDRLSRELGRQVVITDREFDDPELLHSAQVAVESDHELLDAAEDLDMNLDFAMSEGIALKKVFTSAEIQSDDPGNRPEQPTATSPTDHEWRNLKDGHRRWLLSRGGIVMAGDDVMFASDGIDDPSAVIGEIPIDSMDSTADGRELRFPVDLSSPVLLFPSAALLIPPGKDEYLTAALTTDGEFAYLQTDIYPTALANAEPAAVQPAQSVQPVPAVKRSGGIMSLVIPAVISVIFLTGLYVWSSPDSQVNDSPVSSIRSGLFEE